MVLFAALGDQYLVPKTENSAEGSAHWPTDSRRAEDTEQRSDDRAQAGGDGLSNSGQDRTHPAVLIW